MEKTAQHRTLYNKIREWSNISGKAIEKIFDPQFKKVMASLRQIDNNIRSIVAGEPLGMETNDEGDEVPGDAGKYAVSMKDLVKRAKSNFNRREYMAVTADLSIFQLKLAEITAQINKLDTAVDSVHHQFLFGTKDKTGITEEQWQHLQELKSRLAHQQRMELIKQASVLTDFSDWLHNIRDSRARSLKAWEKRYPAETRKIRKEAESLIKNAETILNQTISALKEMAHHRSVRHPGDYVKVAESLIKKYETYDNNFKAFYKENIKGFLEKAEDLYPKNQKEDSKIEKVINEEVARVFPKSPTTESGAGQQAPVSVAPAPSPAPTPVPVQVVAPKVEEVKKLEAVEPAPDTEKNPTKVEEQTKEQLNLPFVGSPPFATKSTKEPLNLPLVKIPGSKGKPSNKNALFYQSLSKLSKEDPKILASFIKKYANSIQSTDPATAIKLLQIVKNIKE